MNSGTNKKLALAAMICAVSMTFIDQTIVSIAVPELQKDLSTLSRLYVKSLDSLDSQPVPGTEGGSQPFFSPDGKSIGFVANGVMMRTQLGGGTPVPIVSASTSENRTA